MQDSQPVTWPEVRALLGRRGFQQLVGVRIVGQIGDGMVQAALTSFVLFSPERQATPMKIAAAFAILLLPYSFFGPFIGLLIDRWRRQRILFWASLLRMLSVALIAVVVVTGDDGLLLGAAVLVSLGIGRFLQATLSAALPHVARDRELITANAVAPTAGTIASAFGGLTGVAVAQLGGEAGTLWTLAFAALMQLCAAAIAQRIGADLLGPEQIVRGLAERMRQVAVELLAGWRFLARRGRAWRAVAATSLHRSAFGIVSVSAIILLRNAINAYSEANSALIELAVTVGGAAFGAFVGAVMAPPVASRLGIRNWMRIALFVGAAGTASALLVVVMLPKSSVGLPALVLAGMFIGWAGQSVKVCSDSTVQAEIDDNHRGRVFAIYDMALNVGLFSGIFIAAATLAPDGRSLSSAFITAAILLGASALLRVPPFK